MKTNVSRKPVPPKTSTIKKGFDGCAIVVLMVAAVVVTTAWSGCKVCRTTSSEQDAGEFVNATMTEGSLNKPAICRVETTKGIFLVPGLGVSGLKGERCTVVNTTDGCRFLRIGGRPGFLFEVD